MDDIGCLISGVSLVFIAFLFGVKACQEDKLYKTEAVEYYKCDTTLIIDGIDSTFRIECKKKQKLIRVKKDKL